MKLPAGSEMMESLVQARKEILINENLLQEEIDRLRKGQASPSGSSINAEDLAALDEQLQKLSNEKADLVRKRKDLCSIARIIGAGD